VAICRFNSAVASILLACVLSTSLASAQISPIARATAEALFQQGVQLMNQGDFSQACDKFAGTLELEPGLGTMLHLADCYDKLGRTASSWALFEEVASRARLAGDTTRESIAATRASELESRLSLVYLTLTDVVGASTKPSAVRVKIGETVIPSAMWGSPIPVDPGQQFLAVSAEGYETWSFQLVVAPGPSVQRVTIPSLKRKALLPSVATPLSRPTRVSLPTPPAYPEQRSSATRVFGYISGAMGLIGLGIAGYFGYRAYQKQQDSLDLCRASNPNSCTPDGVEQRAAAIRFANNANVSAIAGGACLLLGTTLLIISPSSPDAPTTGAPTSSDPTSHARTWVNPAGESFGSPSVTLRGVW
jgi:hypothetical protein